MTKTAASRTRSSASLQRRKSAAARRSSAPQPSRRDLKPGEMLDATTAKNRFGEVLKRSQTEPVFIERHGRAEAVMLSVERYDQLVNAVNRAEERRLEELKGEFNALYENMQTQPSRSVIEGLSRVSAQDMRKTVSTRSGGRGR